MRLRTSILLGVLVLVLAACSPATDAADTTTTTSAAAETTTTAAPDTTAASSTEAQLLSYKLEAGDQYTYEVGIDQSIELKAEGDATALGEEEIPGDMSLDLTGTTTFTHSVAEGPEEGTYEVRITGDFTNLSISGTIDGEPFEESEIPDFTEIEPIDITVIVDEQGNIIPQDDELGDLFGGDLGSLGDFAGAGSSPGQFVGPPFPNEEVAVGDTWSETIELPGMLTEEPVTTEINSEVVGTDTVDGNDVFVIDTRSVTSMIEFDLGAFLFGFLTAFVPEDATPEEQAEIEALAEDLRFLFTIDETTSDLTTWFDAEAGYARMAEFSSSTHFVMDINMPDEETGEMVGFIMDMSIAQSVTYHLTDASSA